MHSPMKSEESEAERTYQLIQFLTAVLVETGAMPVPTKSQNPIVCG